MSREGVAVVDSPLWDEWATIASRDAHETRIGITGHQHLRDEGGWAWVDAAITRAIRAARPPRLGVSSLATGADQCFADAILAEGGALIAVIPFADYGSRFADDVERAAYERLRGLAVRVETLDGTEGDEPAYLAAGHRVVDLSNLIVAVWDGRDAKGVGGTGDAVAYALTAGKPVLHINPETREVRRL